MASTNSVRSHAKAAIRRMKDQHTNKAVYRREDTHQKIRKLDDLWNVDDQDEDQLCLTLDESVYHLAFFSFYLDQREKDMIRILDDLHKLDEKKAKEA
jgi:hypothetical protein